MTDERIQVPEGMLKAAIDAQEMRCDPTITKIGVEAALRWWKANPIEPTDDDCISIGQAWNGNSAGNPFWKFVATEWQRRMFLAPEPEVPEEIKDLLLEPANKK